MSSTHARIAFLGIATALATSLGPASALATPKHGTPQKEPGQNGPVPSPEDNGNRGSVWVSEGGGSAPGHDPRLGCGDILVWGAKLVDEGGPYEISSWPPTGSRTTVTEGRWTATAADGRSSVIATLDGAVLTRAAALSGISAHPRQGYHVKLSVMQGAGEKHKTFWVDCPPAPERVARAEGPQPVVELGAGITAAARALASEVLAATSLASQGTVAPVGPGGGGDSAADVMAASATSGAAAMVLGAQVVRPQSLPLTGGDWAVVTGAALGMVGTGTMLARRARRPRDGRSG